MTILTILKHIAHPNQPLMGGFPRLDWRKKYKVDFELNGSSPTEYPQVVMPRLGAAIILPAKGGGRNIKKGPGEGCLCQYVLQHHLLGFHDNVALSAGRHRYVPDLAYIDAERGIFIDIENDEPYTIGRKIPTHCMGGKDEERNQAFSHSGWIIVRFSERQSFENPAGCIRFIYDLLRKIDPSVDMPPCLEKASPTKAEPRWDYKRAKLLAAKDYRKSYMNKKLEWRLYYTFLSH